MRTNYKKVATRMADSVYQNAQKLEKETARIYAQSGYDQAQRYSRLYDAAVEAFYGTLGGVNHYVEYYKLPTEIKREKGEKQDA